MVVIISVWKASGLRISANKTTVAKKVVQTRSPKNHFTANVLRLSSMKIGGI